MISRPITLAIATALYSTVSALAQTSPAQTAPTQSSPTQASPTQASPTQATPAQAPPSQASPAQASPAQASPAEASAAQALSPTRGPPTPDITQLTVTPEQQGKIKALVASARSAMGSSVQWRAGATLPSSIELHALPAELGLGSYQYAHVGDQVLVVDPDTRSVIQVIQ